MKRKCLAVGIILLFLVAGTIPALAQTIEKPTPPTARGDWLYVGGSGPGNYTRIQDAIENASHGDTVFVYNGIYVEYNINVDSSIFLIGENASATIINGNEQGDVLVVSAPGVQVQGFTIKRSGMYHDTCGARVFSNFTLFRDVIFFNNEVAIDISFTQGCLVENCSFLSNGVGVRMDTTFDTVITGNRDETWSFDNCIYIKNGSLNTISHNQFINHDGWGIYCIYAEHTVFSDNIFQSCAEGLIVVFSNNSFVIANKFIENDEGLSITGSTGNQILENEFTHNGVFLYNAYHNTFTGNLVNGLPLVVLEDQSTVTVPGEVGQVILINSDHILIENKVILDTNVAFELWDTDNCVIQDNILINNTRSLYLYNSHRNIIDDNHASSSTSLMFNRILELTMCTETVVTNNDFTTTDEYTYAFVDSSPGSQISNNEFHGPSLIMTYSDKSIVKNNEFYGSGIRLFACRKMTVDKNMINTGYIELEASHATKITRNTISQSSKEYALVFDGANRNYISRNILDHCSSAIVLYGSRFNVFTKNSVLNCGETPVWFSNSLLNIWARNYWGEPVGMLYRIPGELRIPRWQPYIPPLVIPVFTFDLFSKSVPPLNE